jgi:hypothetical protein
MMTASLRRPIYGPHGRKITGFPQTWREWRTVMPVLAERHTVVALDLRGGGSGQAPWRGSSRKSRPRAREKQLGKQAKEKLEL